MKIGYYSFYKCLNNERIFKEHNLAGGGTNTNFPNVLLAERLSKDGHELSIINKDNVGKIKFDKVLIYDFPENPLTHKPDSIFSMILSKHSGNIYFICMETPAIKPSNWRKDYHAYFRKIFTWNSDYIDGNRYIRLNSTSHSFKEKPTQVSSFRKRLCTALFRNKFSAHPASCYKKREEVIRWLEENAPQEFDFYGEGWDRQLFSWPLRIVNYFDAFLRKISIKLKKFEFLSSLFSRMAVLNRVVYRLIRRKKFSHPSYKGQAQNSREILSQYKFSLCFENSIFPGWITERIFDSFLSGCVPVYLGAPDISKFIPEGTFIDYRKFNEPKEMFLFLKEMPDSVYSGYIEKIKNFLKSRENYLFTAEYFVEAIAGGILSQ